MTNKHPYSRKLLPPTTALMAFDAAAKTGSFTLAANEMCLSQGAVSRQILQLENILGTRLFERVRKRVVLTPAGVFYAERVNQVLAGIAAATAETMASRGQGRVLRLGVLPSFGTRWLIPRMRDFFALHHDVTVHFTSQPPGPFDFVQQNLDAAITFGTPAGAGVRRHRLMGGELIPVAAPSLIQQRVICAPGDIGRATLLAHVAQPRAWIDWFAAHGLEYAEREPMLSFEQFSMIVPAAVAALGVALVPGVIVESELASGSLVRLFPPSVLTRRGQYHYLMYPIEKQDYPPVVAFRDWLLRNIAERRVTQTEITENSTVERRTVSLRKNKAPTPPQRQDISGWTARHSGGQTPVSSRAAQLQGLK